MRNRGRPRSYDRADALERLMRVFWEKGYDGAQIRDLVAALGVAAPSFYASFGSKEAAFEEALALYVERIASRPMHLLNESRSVSEGICAMLQGSVEVALSTNAGGCMLILGVTARLPGNERAYDCVQAWRLHTVRLIVERLMRAVDEGDLRERADVRQLADFLHGVMQAISFQARDGSTRDRLLGLIDPAISAIPVR